MLFLQKKKPIISGSICWGAVFCMQTIIMGWTQAFRREMKKVFPEDELVEIPWEHPILIRNINFRRDCPKFMSTMRNGRKLWGSSRKEDWWFYLLSRPTWEMAGKTLKCITILKTGGRKPCGWGRILFLMCFPTEKRLK